MSKSLIRILALTGFLGTLVSLVAQQDVNQPVGSQPPVSQAMPADSAPAIQTVPGNSCSITISPPAITPGVLAVKTPGILKIIATITNEDHMLPKGAALFRVGGPGTNPVFVAPMFRAKPGTYEIALPFYQASPHVYQFKVAAWCQSSNQWLFSPSASVITIDTATGFTVDKQALANGGPFSINNFNGKYLSGGVIPPGGAAIDVTTMATPPPPLINYIDVIELAGSTINSTTSLTVSGMSCTDVVYTDTYSTTLTYSNEAIYCPLGGNLYKFYLSFIVGDPKASQYSASFQKLVLSTTFPSEE